MGKPKKNRYVQSPPSVVFFKPQGIPMVELEQVVLELDEFEAIRLVDHEGLQQGEAAQRMKVSRGTCARILDSAHRKVASALVRGTAIRIQGGSFVLEFNRYRCQKCNSTWQTSHRASPKAAPASLVCPRCRSNKVLDLGRRVGSEYPLSGSRGALPHRGRHGWGRGQREG